MCCFYCLMNEAALAEYSQAGMARERAGGVKECQGAAKRGRHHVAAQETRGNKPEASL